MKTAKKEVIPLAISILLILISFGVVLSTNYIFSIEHYIGIGLLILSIILYIKRYDLYIYVFILTLLAGLIGLIDFYYTTLKIGVGAFAINPIFLILIILFLALNKDKLNTMFPEKNQSNIIELNEKQIALFKTKFQDKSEMELLEISKMKSRYVNEAKIAAEQILKEKTYLKH